MDATDYSNLSDLALLELCVWREARGEPFDGKRGVAHVIRNRVYSSIVWWGIDWHSVVLHPWQFSSFNEHDPNAALWPSDLDASFVDCCQAAVPVYNGADDDLTLGALWYKVSAIPWPHGWGDQSKYQLTATIGHHSFYREAAQPALGADETTQV